VPPVTRPLIVLALVILITAQLTGGMGFQAFGGEAFGGKRYVFLLGGIVGYFALIARRISAERANLYISLFFLCGVTIAIASIGPLLHPSLYFIFAVFPVENTQALMEGGLGDSESPYVRSVSLSFGGLAAVTFMLARHGMRGIVNFGEQWRFLPFQVRSGLSINQPWRGLLFLPCVWVSLLGGFRTTAITLAVMMGCQAYFEGLFRTRLLPIFVSAVLLIGAVGLPFVDRLPFAIQRSLSFLPLPIDPVAKYTAEDSSEWRLRIWRVLLPEVPKYLLLGKGYSINASDLEMSGAARFARTTEVGEGSMIAGDYHSGPLSLLIPLGLPGAIGFIWFLIASLHVLRQNYRHGDPALGVINSFLLSYFITRTIMYFFVFGSLYSDLVFFTGLVGLSISLNGGVCGPALATSATPAVNEFRSSRVAR
jgi:hypothetical protein